MVKLKYSALYTDNLGCEQAEVYFSKEGFQLKVRNSIFYNDNFNFDFYAKNSEDIEHLFYLKDDELIDYSIDIKIPLLLVDNNNYCVKEFLLRVERKKNYYNNSLSFSSKDLTYLVQGYNLQELLYKMKKELPEGYFMKDENFLCMFGVFYLEMNKESPLYSLEISDEIWKDNYINLYDKAYEENLKNYKKVHITYIGNEYCIS
ncbi:DUF6304 family protein [Clostridium sp.]|uniref:DUF6304 family protein n=1 Tax=Clostridium sp. TaxID=1506 RepID=UPI002637451B|nr:DUF6304 family protein [Clostridium sp.]